MTVRPSIEGRSAPSEDMNGKKAMMGKALEIDVSHVADRRDPAPARRKFDERSTS